MTFAQEWKAAVAQRGRREWVAARHRWQSEGGNLALDEAMALAELRRRQGAKDVRLARYLWPGEQGIEYLEYGVNVRWEVA